MSSFVRQDLEDLQDLQAGFASWGIVIDIIVIGTFSKVSRKSLRCNTRAISLIIWMTSKVRINEVHLNGDQKLSSRLPAGATLRESSFALSEVVEARLRLGAAMKK
jgi:hypothetical protein